MAAVDEVEEVIMARMLRGVLAPGTRMRQDEITEEMQLSKIPVREGLQRLTAFGLLRSEPNRGLVVPDLTATDAEEICMKPPSLMLNTPRCSTIAATVASTKP